VDFRPYLECCPNLRNYRDVRQLNFITANTVPRYCRGIITVVPAHVQLSTVDGAFSTRHFAETPVHQLAMIAMPRNAVVRA